MSARKARNCGPGCGRDCSRVSVVIQAGGESRRMGTDKALVPFLGRPMIERVIERVSPVADEILITSNSPESFAYLGLKVFPDLLPGRGALGGLFTAFSVAHHELVCVLACDMAFVSSSLLIAELQLMCRTGADAVVPLTASGHEPFHAVYRKDVCRDAVRDALGEGRKRADSWYPNVNMVTYGADLLDGLGMDLSVFVNANTPEELKAAELLASCSAVLTDDEMMYLFSKDLALVADSSPLCDQVG
ncbi:MAG: molybdenum cofactor guanylyltransferase [Coriobacteriia bacterium]|nr:molybdenum cofactor guanylyltransferase [Coriobacteriia bacterium]